MDYQNVRVSDLILHSEEYGEEVGYPDIEIVGLYSDRNKTCYYYVDVSNDVVLDVFPTIE